MRRLLYIGLLFICVLLVSCIDKSASGVFDKAERYMEIYPDSALLLLSQISHPERLHGKQQADYALLLTQARDKNYLDSLQSDSLIKIAVDYYRGSEDRVRAGKAFLYYGKVMALQGNDTVAMQAYQDAQTALEGTKEYGVQALICQYIGSLNDERGMYDMALDNYRKSISYNKKVSDTLRIVYTYRSIAWIHEIKQNYDSAGWYAKTGLSLLRWDSLSPVFPSLLQLLGEQELRKRNYNEAITYFSSAIKFERIPHSIFHYYISLGDTYLQLEQFGKAEECFKNVLASKDIYTQSGAYYYLYLLEKKRLNYAKSLSYKEKSDSLLGVSKDLNSRNQILTMQRKYEVDKLLMENKMLAQKKQLQLYSWLIICFLMIGFSVISYFWLKKQYRKIYKKRMKAHIERELRMYQENELAINQYIHQIEDLKQKEVLAVENTKEMIGNLNRKIQILVNDNKEIRENFGVTALCVLKQLKEGLLTVENMTRQEKMNVFRYMDLLSGNLITRLKKDYNLNENNLLLIVLIKLGFTTAELVIAYDCEENSVYRKKQRLKEKLHLEKQQNLETFLTQNPLYLSTI